MFSLVRFTLLSIIFTFSSLSFANEQTSEIITESGLSLSQLLESTEDKSLSQTFNQSLKQKRQDHLDNVTAELRDAALDTFQTELSKLLENSNVHDEINKIFIDKNIQQGLLTEFRHVTELKCRSNMDNGLGDLIYHHTDCEYKIYAFLDSDHILMRMNKVALIMYNKGEWILDFINIQSADSLSDDLGMDIVYKSLPKQNINEDDDINVPTNNDVSNQASDESDILEYYDDSGLSPR